MVLSMRSNEELLGEPNDTHIPVDITPQHLYTTLRPYADSGDGSVSIMDTRSETPMDAVIVAAHADVWIRPDESGKPMVVFSCYIEMDRPITNLSGSDVVQLEKLADYLRSLGSYVGKDSLPPFKSVHPAGPGKFVINVEDPDGVNTFLEYTVKVADQRHLQIETKFFPWEGLNQERLHDLLENFAEICARVIQGYYEIIHVNDVPVDKFAFFIKKDDEKSDWNS